MFRLQGTSNADNQTLIEKKNSYGLAIRDGYLQVSTNTNGLRTKTLLQTNQISNNNWMHIARTYNESEMDIYLNGILSWTGRLIGYFPTNQYPTIIGSGSNGQF